MFCRPVHILVSGGGLLKNILSERVGRVYDRMLENMGEIQEIRLRSDQPLIVRYRGEDRMVDAEGRCCTDKRYAFRTGQGDVEESMAYICQYSLYAYEDEMRQGFITVQGGHRIGVAGRVVHHGGQIQSMTHVSSLNIRVSHQIKGCGEAVFPWLWEYGLPCHTLIVSPPGGGKTTLLRDFIRLFSDGFGDYPGMSVSLIDERSEVGASYMGMPQNDLGMRTDILDGCPKAEGIQMMVRSMGPQVVAFDELGGAADIRAVDYAVHSGCRVLTTMHGRRMQDVTRRLDAAGNLFQRFVFLGSGQQTGQICRILDGSGQILYGVE